MQPAALDSSDFKILFSIKLNSENCLSVHSYLSTTTMKLPAGCLFGSHVRCETQAHLLRSDVLLIQAAFKFPLTPAPLQRPQNIVCVIYHRSVKQQNKQ